MCLSQTHTKKKKITHKTSRIIINVLQISKQLSDLIEGLHTVQNAYGHKSTYNKSNKTLKTSTETTSPTSRVTNIACPMCNEPVTLGGGIEITKESLPLSKFGLKYP